MGRVTPFIFVATMAVAAAVYQARTGPQTATLPVMPADPVTTTELHVPAGRLTTE